MNKKSPLHITTTGTSEITRYSKALEPTYFSVDERSLSELLTFSIEYARFIRFKNLENQWEGDWAVFFENNLAFLLGTISAFEVESHTKKFNRVHQLLETEEHLKERLEILWELFELTFAHFRTLDEWYRRSKSDVVHLEKNGLVRHLQNAIDPKLKTDLHGYRGLLKKARSLYLKDKFPELSFDEFDRLWSADDELNVTPNDESIAQIVKELSVFNKSLTSVLNYLKSLAPGLLPSVLKQYPFHAPQASLFLSFVKLFEHVQKDLNDLSRRHLDYYYEELLKQSPKGASPDFAHVCFEPAANVLKSNIPSGTILTAGVDEEGYELTYATEASLELGQSKIVDLRIIHVARNPLIGLGSTYRSVSNVYSRTISPSSSGFVTDESGNATSFEIMGRDQSDLNEENRDMEVAKLGFAISSPVLMMSEGERSIKLDFYFQLKSMGSLVSFIEEITSRESLTPDNAFYKILNNIFRVQVSGKDGWFETDRYEIMPPDSWTDGNIRIELTFDISDPAIAPYDAELHGDDYENEWPVLEFTLSSRYAMYGYSYLKDLVVQRCEIEVEAQKVRSLEVFNDLGQLDSSKPFYPFGSTPDIGSYFLIGHEELCLKKLDDVSLNLQWHNLPREYGGMAEYFKDYPEKVENSSFMVGVTGLSEFQFHPIQEEVIQQFSLFDSMDDSTRLASHRKIENIDLEKIEIQPTYESQPTMEFDNRTRTGFLKLEVTAPSMGFGHGQFPNLFSEAVVANSANTSGVLSKEKEKTPIPKEPLAPQLRSISLNYKASAKLFMNPDQVSQNERNSNDKIFHLHPYGNLTIFHSGLPQQKIFLLPQYDEEGYLLLGLEGLSAPMELSLYFELRANLQNVINYNTVPQTNWRYLVGDEWKAFDENDIIFDGTNNFSTSGIIKLNISAEMDLQHSFLPSGRFWLSVSAPEHTDVLSKVVFIKTNAAKVEWKKHKEGAEWQENIPAKTISGFLSTRTDVNSVVQPFASFGGKKPEHRKQFYTRVAERLKHKNRAITPEDYEKLILNEFPDLFQVKCLNQTSFPDSIEAGKTKIIVVPKVKLEDGFYLPRVDYHRMQVIEDFLKDRVSPFAKFEVINPVYEKVRISCKVRFKSEKKQGEFINQMKRDIRSFICPWFHKNQKEMNFGGSIERDDVLTYIESLEYIQFVTKLSIVILHYKDGRYSISDSASDDGRINELWSSTPWSVLVPDEEHEISIVDKSTHELPQETRIETMRIGADFVIDDDKDEDAEFLYIDLDKDTYYVVEIDV